MRKFNIEEEVSKSVEYCSEVLAEMYNLPLDKAKWMVTNSPFPNHIRKDPVAFGHFSYEDNGNLIYQYHVRLGNV